MQQDLGRVKGTMWYSGTAITGTSATPTVFDTDITYALEEDMYLNTDNGNVYRCTLQGDDTTAKWVYIANIRGPVADIVDNLTTNSGTKALSARQGKVLNEKLLSSGVYPKSVDLDLETTVYIAEIEIRNIAGTLTLSSADDSGTYSFEPIGTSEHYTVSLDIDSSIGFETTGALLTNITFTDNIYGITLKDSNADTIISKTFDAWEEIELANKQVKPSGYITDGVLTLHEAKIQKEIEGNLEQLYPITHAKAVYYSKTNNKTMYDKMSDVIDGLDGSTTVFNQDGTITQTYSDRVITTTFNQDGSITEVITKGGTTYATKTTTFNLDGSITETIS